MHSDDEGAPVSDPLALDPCADRETVSAGRWLTPGLPAWAHLASIARGYLWPHSRDLPSPGRSDLHSPLQPGLGTAGGPQRTRGVESCNQGFSRANSRAPADSGACRGSDSADLLALQAGSGRQGAT